MRALPLVAVLACACGREAPPSRLDSIDLALRRGGVFLASRQSPDGALRSRTYAALRDGWSLTPLAALALRMAPQDPAIASAYRRAVDFVAGLVVGGERVRGEDEVEYPFYAYAIGALVLGGPDNARHRAAHARLLAMLRTYQLSAANGWLASDASLGGWGYARTIPRRPAGAVDDDLLTANLSATVLAIGALALGGTPANDPALVAARGFVERCGGADGGFHFSPALADGNKAGAAADGSFRSYGSMTADGTRALLRLGASPTDPRVAAALAWLDRHFDASRNPGDFPGPAEVRRDSSYYYWAWTIAHLARHANRRAWADALADELLRRQQPDGSWRNPASELREDDPVVATSFAIAALALCRSVIANEQRSHAY